MSKKLKIAVLMGGKSSEHDISLISGKEVVTNFPSKYSCVPIVIPKNGNGWLNELLEANVDLCFIAMHGSFGEDGTIQGLLDSLGIKYTGSGVSASAIGMDKILFRKIMKAEDLPIPEYVVIDKKQKIFSLSSIGNPPYFIKPHNQGSSLGVSKITKIKELQKALNYAFKFSNKVIIDKYVKGLEVTCAVLGNEDPFAFPIVEIKYPKNSFFDYKLKYSEFGAHEIVPAKISKDLTNKIQKLSVGVHKLIGARGFSRTDFILKDDKYPVILEINTIPGLTPMSLLPKSAKAAGMSYKSFIQKIIDYAK